MTKLHYIVYVNTCLKNLPKNKSLYGVFKALVTMFNECF